VSESLINMIECMNNVTYIYIYIYIQKYVRKEILVKKISIVYFYQL